MPTNKPINTSSAGQQTFNKELNTDQSFLEPDSWLRARNAINNSVSGDLGRLGNEPSNLKCITAPYPIIGFIFINADRWAVFSTDNVNSEIGLFEESKCSYKKIVNDTCLGFSQLHLIKGQSRPTSDCTYQIYWDDGINPSRTMDIDNPVYIQQCLDENGVDINTAPSTYTAVGCITCTDTARLDCDALRLARFVDPPCMRIEKGVSGGTLPNGTYIAFLAYVINGQRFTDYFLPSNQQPIFDHNNVAGSIDIIIDSIDERYDDFELVIVTVINQQTVARRIGVYSTQQKKITLDNIEATWESIPIEQLLTITPVYDKSDAMYAVNDYLLRVGPTTKIEPNYQPLANQIVTKWVSVEYPANYYQNGGSNTGYMRDEVYPFFIRLIYDTGDKTPCYHIPGRPSFGNYNGLANEDGAYVGSDSLPGDALLFETYNTASQVGPTTAIALPDGGVQIAEGYMGYWQSTEKYPDKNQTQWNAVDPSHPATTPTALPYPGTNVNTDYNLCAKNIRHHKFPDNAINIGTGYSNLNTNHYTGSSPNFGNQAAIRVLGVKFENIRTPLDNNGNPITNIVGYEILRGSRQGHRTVIAKGMINSMGLFTVDNGITTRTGAYPNYPYNDRNPDPFLVTDETYYKMCIFGSFGGEYKQSTQSPLTTADQFQNFSKKLYSFHSPDTNFNKPFLSGKEVKIYGELRGTATGKFEYSEHHPKFKMVSNMAFIISAISGIGLALLSINGKKVYRAGVPKKTETAFAGTGSQVTPGAGLWGLLNPAVIPFEVAAVTASSVASAALDAYLTTNAGAELIQNLLGLEDVASYSALLAAFDTAGAVPGVEYSDQFVESEQTAFTQTPAVLRIATTLPNFSYFWGQGTDTIMNVIRGMLRYRDFALKYNSHCYYDGFIPPPGTGERRRTITNQEYLNDKITDMGDSINGYKINNLHRSKTVAIEVSNDIVFPGPDNTRQRASDRPELFENGVLGNPLLKDPTKRAFNTTSSCYYVGYKQRIKNQYGQLEGILQVPVSTCPLKIKKTTTSPILFNGDIYVARYTEKNTFFYFYDWLYDQPDGYEFNYLAAHMLPYPRYWMNSQKYESNDFVQGLMANIGSIFSGTSSWSAVMPSNFFNLDGYTCNLGSILTNANFAIKYAYFYLFNSGVRDFFVESEVNVGLRDWGELDAQKHYPILDEKALFDTAIIKSGNYFKQDPSLNISKNLIQMTGWGKVQDRAFDPLVAESCYHYYPNQVIYSLPANQENVRDQWRFFLANNYKLFTSKITAITPVNKSGALILFQNESPDQFYGVDQLQTDGGTKLTIGDGGLFQQPLQSITNADKPYQYASCQDRLSAINTPSGVYFISQALGKIFNYSGQGLLEISAKDIKWWFASYLPYQLTQQFPDFELIDNPYKGIGCQAIYDNENTIVYFSKRDYIVRKDLPSTTTVEYKGDNLFLINGLLTVELGDPDYFEDASWTISYDPKIQAFLSWHDWHPDLVLPGKNTFMTVLNNTADPNDANSIWVHNERCDSYCKYYNVNYPFEIEFTQRSGATVNTLRSIEYYLEVYKYDFTNCTDRFHALDFNFNEAVIYNTEQCSGLLRLNLTPKNNALERLNYPQINAASVDILYSKEEQKYRFNQFWDMTDSRGEFPIGSAYPPPTPNPGTYAERMIWNTAANGYVRTLNPANLDYNKNEIERKKFRHYVNNVLLRRTFTADTEKYKMMVMLSQVKNLYSPR